MQKISTLSVFCEHACKSSVSNIYNIINYCMSNRITFIRPDDIDDLFNGKLPVGNYSLLTFDDGDESRFDDIAKLLRQNSIKAISFVIPLNSNFMELKTNFEYFLKYPDVFELGSHSLTHTMSWISKERGTTITSPCLNYPHEEGPYTFYYGLTNKTILKFKDRVETNEEFNHRLYTEILFSKNWIEYVTGKECKFFAYPWGIHNPNIIKIVKDAGYKYAFSINVSDKSQFTIPRWYHNDISKLKKEVLINNVNVISNRIASQSDMDKKYGIWK